MPEVGLSDNELALVKVASEPAVNVAAVEKLSVVPDSEISESPIPVELVNLAKVPVVPDPDEPVPHSQTAELEFHFSTWVFVHPPNNLNPSELTSKPEFDEEVLVVLVVVASTVKVTPPELPPPDKPLPAVTPVIVPLPPVVSVSQACHDPLL